MTNYDKELEISKMLKMWYKENKRSLPWRESNDPYKIWISEVILQQTRVAQGIDYYYRFIERFPTVSILAASSEEEVLKEWQGLGYYSRARNLHAAAKAVVLDYGGVLPDSHKALLSLKGIGEYTAAAVLSTAFNKPYAVVDGNVYRVLSRLFAIDTPIDTSKGRKQFAQLAKDLLDVKNPGIHNQALMEFGALHCIPTQPKCNTCPISHLCVAKQMNKQTNYPLKDKKIKIRKRYFHYFRVVANEYTFLNKRVGDDIWKNMYDFPLIETDKDMTFEELSETSAFKSLFKDAEVTFSINHKQVKHVLTHQHIYAIFHEVAVSKITPRFHDNFLKVKTEEVHKYPISRLIHRYLERISH